MIKNFPKSYALYKEVVENEPDIITSTDVKYYFVYTRDMLKTEKLNEEFLSNYEALSAIVKIILPKVKK